MGKLIVIEGTDGSGKSTQFRLLTQRLENENIAFRKIVFPIHAPEGQGVTVFETLKAEKNLLVIYPPFRGRVFVLMLGTGR